MMIFTSVTLYRDGRPLSLTGDARASRAQHQEFNLKINICVYVVYKWILLDRLKRRLHAWNQCVGEQKRKSNLFFRGTVLKAVDPPAYKEKTYNITLVYKYTYIY